MNQHIYGRLLLLTLVLTACTGSFMSGSTSTRITIAFMTLPMEPPGQWEDLITSFEKANPTIHIELYYQMPDDWPKRADVALGFGLVWWRDIVDRGWVLDLAPLIESDRGFDVDDFYPGVLALHQQDKHTWAIPVGETLDVLVYQPELFQKVGVPLPGLEWSWADVMEAARQLGADPPDGKARYSFLDQGEAQILALDWLAEQSKGLHKKEDGSVVPTLDRIEVRQALSDYMAIADKVTFLLAEPGGITAREVLDRIAQGEVGMTIMGLRTVTDYLDQYPDIAIAPLPPGNVVAQLAVRPSSELAISAGTAHPEAAWRWVSFLSRQDLVGHRLGDLPARRSVVELNGAWDQMSPKVAQVIHSSLENQTGRSHIGLDTTVGFVYDAISMALVNVQEGQTDIETALAGAQQEALDRIYAWQEKKNSVTPLPFSVSAPSPSAGTTIEFQVGSSLHEQLYRAAAKGFEDIHPDWHVQVSLDSTQPESSCLSIYVDGSALTTVLMQGLLTNLDPLVEVNPFSIDDFLPQAVAAVTWQGKLYAVPSTVKPLVLYYNSDIFQRAGLEPPTSDWTVEDVLAAAEQIVASGQGDFGYLPQGHDIPFLLQQQGISLFTDDRPPRPRFTASEVLQALQRLHRLGSERVNFSTSFSEMLSLTENGRVGMWFTVFGYRPGADWPAGTGVTAIQMRPGTPLPMQVGALGLASGVQHSQVCWEWINFLAQQGVSIQDELPAMRHLAESRATRQALGDDLFVAYREALRDEEAPARNAIVEDWAAWWFIQALRETEMDDLETALQTAQSKAEAFITCLGATDGQDLKQAQMCAQQTDSDHPLAHIVP